MRCCRSNITLNYRPVVAGCCWLIIIVQCSDSPDSYTASTGMMHEYLDDDESPTLYDILRYVFSAREKERPTGTGLFYSPSHFSSATTTFHVSLCVTDPFQKLVI